MKVKELIALLKRQDPNAKVCWQAHDQADDECDGWVRYVREGSAELCAKEAVAKLVVLAP